LGEIAMDNCGTNGRTDWADWADFYGFFFVFKQNSWEKAKKSVKIRPIR
jgi:hypothetical protein